jgi:hypothetical protein
MEEGFEPSDYLAIITSNKKRIKYFSPDNSDQSLNELIDEVKIIKDRLNMASGK